MEIEYLFVFSSRSEAMRFYKLLSANSINSRIKSTPVSISNCCSLSVAVSECDYRAALRVASSVSRLSVTGVYELKRQGLSIKTRRIR